MMPMRGVDRFEWIKTGRTQGALHGWRVSTFRMERNVAA
jgi:hypothetical protein